MADYIRARSGEHKEERFSQIKQATAELFENVPYAVITLTMIAEKLGWSRANLYKYVTTKEEIILKIAADKMSAYYGSLLSAFPDGNNFSVEVIAEIWAGILNANQDYMRYVSYLNPVIETNVTVERLAAFKKQYYDFTKALSERLSEMLDVTQEAAYKIQLDVLFYASSNAVCCYKNPLVQEALKQINITPLPMDFYQDMKKFVKMRIEYK
ncbi:TetR family transcriptional regulator [Treponema putidum]|uniref:TetR/AcrR family transcriptional regulator n=1 Tax=Treponema putidum TaxID=221027 RepID=A0AAE9MVZ2_9SPIR|nr:TetR family transcriptional regulator [Treponema putidum]AIN93658.1 TetR family transcriptional regulator [Treponema putidum]TWI77750.1 TetR family transcriptional regulator [Treponema putidum]UTY29901.1 TetR/AcrR family transcriptional regulator [Treponema putidum]UTY32357.1 TetR/AcrR family transcriptional regulator [Treponema putidum]UTY34761.1 TetR/AcrR family transcriptional regulator [Treponema putidum]